jgi:microcystin-dependent protein
MSEPFLGEIKITAFNFAPRGWALCNGQLLPINQNQALFSLLGTTYGGDGRVNFGLPDLRGRIPIHIGSGHTQGERGGETAHTLSIAEMPTHIHQVVASNQTYNSVSPTNAVLAGAPNMYANPSNLTTLVPDTVTNVGGSQAHNNMQPYLVLNFVIALQGIFPSQN